MTDERMLQTITLFGIFKKLFVKRVTVLAFYKSKIACNILSFDCFCVLFKFINDID